MMQCVSHCPLPKKGSTAHGPVCMWWCAPMRHVVWWVVSVDVSVCCGGVAVWRMQKKREEAKTQSNNNKKDFSQNHFFPFPFFSLLFFFHSFLLAFHSSTITPFLFIHTHVFHASHRSASVKNQTHQWRNI